MLMDNYNVPIKDENIKPYLSALYKEVIKDIHNHFRFEFKGV